MTSKLTRFNPRRAMRGVGAAELELDVDDIQYRLWMTESDLKKNLKQFADESPEALQGLKDALAAYATRKEFP